MKDKAGLYLRVWVIERDGETANVVYASQADVDYENGGILSFYKDGELIAAFTSFKTFYLIGEDK